ncbi:metal ABC transporter ATP-binding protein [Naasia sp. SYSU D00948]|uniref:metal ABC transporter ATP-binding protein n=1 Tax=Naasia sp. SYSU D00948 TaxID=2817379 RepID=UPI001B313073|nr:metal ABC transporter ATP-binding protein [Naasia sp. SYSU D00948]
MSTETVPTTVPSTRAAAPVVSVRDAALELGGRTLWSHLDLELSPGELVVVLGPNGAGKSSLLRVLLGSLELASGTAQVLGGPPGSAGGRIGYVPQQKLFDRGAPLRAKDLVGLGFDGPRPGITLRGAAKARAVRSALERVDAQHYASRPVGRLSGGEQQRLRIAQSFVSSPELLLCDEPLLSLDLGHQRAVLDAIDEYRRGAGAGVLLVTHDVNPLLGMVDRVLYLAPAGHRLGAPSEVLTGPVLSELYGLHVDVLDVHGRVVVVAGGSGDDEGLGTGGHA